MSEPHRTGKRKGKHPRWTHKSYHDSRHLRRKRRILRKRGWKLKYPKLFKKISDFPYIVKKDYKEKY